MAGNLKNRYLILNTQSIPVGHCTCRDDPDTEIWRLEVDYADAPKLWNMKDIRLVGAAEYCVAVEGLILRWDGDTVAMVQMTKRLGQELRQNLRLPVRFESFLYSAKKPQGRLPIFSFDLSCGGISFFCAKALPDGMRGQVVIPVTSQPLVLNIEIIRRCSSKESVPMYAAKFVDLLREEENMVREAVFGLQFHHASSSEKGQNR